MKKTRHKIGSNSNILEEEKGTFRKKWTGRFSIALVYPSSYQVGMSSLGFQLVYSLLNNSDFVVCERFFYPSKKESLRSVESGRPIGDFSLVLFSVSFEQDYVNIVKMLLAGGIEPLANDRKKNTTTANQMIGCGGVAVSMNPEPLADFMDFLFVGEAEKTFTSLVDFLIKNINTLSRKQILNKVGNLFKGCYVPEHYTPIYSDGGEFTGFDFDDTRIFPVEKNILKDCETAAYSQLLSPNAEFSNLHLTELGRGCSRGCRFCAAGFIYRPPRLWSGEAVLAGLKKRQPASNRIGLLGMEMADNDAIKKIIDYLLHTSCSLSFSSLRADRINGSLVRLLSESNLKSVAIAPDGASERLRRVINKGLNKKDLINAAERLVSSGLMKLKLYLMIGLPTETIQDLQEFVSLVKEIKETISPIGKKRGRLCEINISINSFTPKPWTPFQYHAFGVSDRLKSGEKGTVSESVRNLKQKIKFLRRSFRDEANIRLSADYPDKVVFQAVLSRGDRRLSSVLMYMAVNGVSWKVAMKKMGLMAEEYAICGSDQNTAKPWSVIGHGIKEEYLWHEYQKSLIEKETIPCDTKICRACGVCGDYEDKR